MIIKSELPKTLCEFLEQNNAIDKFLENVNSVEQSSYTTVLTHSPQEFLMMGFIWKETPEGSDYWAELNLKWENLVGTI
jgi:hypothetical protein